MFFVRAIIKIFVVNQIFLQLMWLIYINIYIFYLLLRQNIINKYIYNKRIKNIYICGYYIYRNKNMEEKRGHGFQNKK